MSEASARKFFVGGNYKANGTKAKIDELVEMMNTGDLPDVDVLIAPPAVFLDRVQKSVRKEVLVCAQNVSAHPGYGAFTGELTSQMLKDFGINWTILGHSERRHVIGETNELIASKCKMAIECGLEVVFCIGEKLEEREAGNTMKVCIEQLEAIASVLDRDAWKHIVVAYEPVWAIGTGKTASPEQAQEVHKDLRNFLAERIDADCAASTRIIYGGSVKAANCKELGAMEDIDGFLVGGASLQPQFLDIIRARV